MTNAGTCDCCGRWFGRRWRVWDNTTDELVWLCDACEHNQAERRGWHALAEAGYRERPAEVGEKVR